MTGEIPEYGSVFESDDGTKAVRFTRALSAYIPCAGCEFEASSCWAADDFPGWKSLDCFFKEQVLECGTGRFVRVDPLEEEIRRVKE